MFIYCQIIGLLYVVSVRRGLVRVPCSFVRSFVRSFVLLLVVDILHPFFLLAFVGRRITCAYFECVYG